MRHKVAADFPAPAEGLECKVRGESDTLVRGIFIMSPGGASLVRYSVVRPRELNNRAALASGTKGQDSILTVERV